MIDNGDSILVDRMGRTPTVVSKTILDEIISSGISTYDIEQALWFYQVTRNAVEHRWVEAAELVHMNTYEYDVHYYQANWEDSTWAVYENALTFFQTVSNNRGISNRDQDFIEAYYGPESETDEDELYDDYRETGWSLYPHQEVLLVKISKDNIAEREAEWADIVKRRKEEREAYENREKTEEEILMEGLFDKE